MPALRHTVIVIIALLVSVTVRAQDDWDSVLDRYEEICSRCIELRERITAGEAVPNAEVTGLLGELSRLRTLIQDSRGRMSAAQRKRFNATRKRYDTRIGNVKDVPTNKATEPRKERNTIAAEPQVMDTVSIRNSYILPRGKKIAGLPPSRLPEYEERGIPARELTARHGTTVQQNTAYGSIRTDIIPIVEFGAKPSFGLFASVAKGQWGGYLSARSTFTSLSTSYTTGADLNIEGGGKFWGNGNSRYGAFTVCTGPVWHPMDALGFYIGTGYGKKTLAWQDAAGEWALVKDHSYAGLGIEAGAVFSFRRFDLLAEAGWLGGWSFLIGLGYSF